MDELQIQERNRQYKARLKYIEEYFNDNIDDNIKHYIFNSTDFKRCVRKVPDYISYINNILSLSFVFAYGCYRIDSTIKPFCCENVKKTGSLRIVNSFKRAYTHYPVTADLVQFILTDIQFDMLQGSNSELYDVFSPFCKFSDRNFSLTKYYKLIKSWKSCPSRFSMDQNELALLFVQLIDNIAFLRDYRLEDGETDFFFIEKKSEIFGQNGKYSYIPTNHLLYKNEQKYRGFFTLFGCERRDDENGKLYLRYVSNDGYNSVNMLVCDKEYDLENRIDAIAEEYYYEITGVDWNFGTDGETSEAQANFINQVHAINYKYIKNLALAISDAISNNKGSKKVLLNAFRVHHPNIFFRENGNTDILDDMDWDGIIVMLLIEASPSKVLEVLIHKVPQTFYDIAKNLCKRIDNPNMHIYGCDDDELDSLVHGIIKNNLIIDEAGGFHHKLRGGEIGGKLFARAASILIISSLSSIMEEDTEEKFICAGNIFENIILLGKMASERDYEAKEKKVSTVLGETLRHLLCFYNGVLSYGSIKAIFDNESCDCSLSQDKIKEYQNKLKDAFMSAAKVEAERLKNYDSSNTKDTIFLLDEFIKLCKKCSANSGSGDIGRCLYVALGKYEIINVNDFEYRISGFFNELKSMEKLSEKAVDYYTEFATDILEFLIYGAFDCTSSNGVLLTAVYPLSATYSRGNENYDGYKTATFTLNIDIEYEETTDNKEDVNVLSEFSYAPGDVFYCLPNVLRSNKKWWIDPVLINFKEFNDIFLK